MVNKHARALTRPQNTLTCEHLQWSRIVVYTSQKRPLHNLPAFTIAEKLTGVNRYHARSISIYQAERFYNKLYYKQLKLLFILHTYLEELLGSYGDLSESI